MVMMIGLGYNRSKFNRIVQFKKRYFANVIATPPFGILFVLIAIYIIPIIFYDQGVFTKLL
jgi:hypothetical protein